MAQKIARRPDTSAFAIWSDAQARKLELLQLELACGAPVLKMHTRPCGECRHFRRTSDVPICQKHLMAVSTDMRVTFWAEPDPAKGRHGLCFEERT